MLLSGIKPLFMLRKDDVSVFRMIEAWLCIPTIETLVVYSNELTVGCGTQLVVYRHVCMCRWE